MMVVQEKQRVEMAFQGLQDVIRAYQSGGSISLPPSPSLLPPQAVAIPNVPFFLLSNPSNGSPPDVGHMIHGSSVINHAQPPMLSLNVAECNKFSTPAPNSSSSDKRKASKSAPEVPPTPKKCCTQSPADSCMMEGITLSSQAICTNNAEDNIMNLPAAQSTSTNAIIPSPAQGLSVEKSLFKQPCESRANSSLKNPPQGLLSQTDKPVSPLKNSSLNAIGASASQNIASSSCYGISSNKIIVSPLKSKGSYSIERSYHVSSSPLKSNSKLSKREHAKGRLDFNEFDLPISLKEPVAIDSSPSTDGETPGGFDFDLPGFDFFDGDLSKLLTDIDLECEGILSCQQSSVPADFIPGPKHNVSGGCLETNQAFPISSLSTVTRIISEDMDIQGPETMTSVRSITKRIKILSPRQSVLKPEEIVHWNKQIHQQNHSYSSVDNTRTD